MTDQERVVFEALGRGRLIFPFREELSALRDQAKAGPLIASEARRYKELGDAFEKIKIKDQWFNSAMETGDLTAAQKVAEEALAILQGVE